VKGASGTDRWPKLIAPYMQDSVIFAAPGDPQNHRARQADPLRNSRNNPSYILNGCNDLGTFEQPNTGAAAVARSTNFLSPSPRDFHPAG